MDMDQGIARHVKVRKDTRNFACRMDAGVFARMEEYVRLSRQSKTAVVELALGEYLERHYDAMRETMRQGGPGGR